MPTTPPRRRPAADIAARLRSEAASHQEQARSEIRKLIDSVPSLTDVLTKHDPSPPPVSWLVEGWMPDATLSVLTGAGGAGKKAASLCSSQSRSRTGANHFIWPANGPVRITGTKAPELLATGPVVFAAWETRKLAWQNRLAAVCGHIEDEVAKLSGPTALHQHATRGRFVGRRTRRTHKHGWRLARRRRCPAQLRCRGQGPPACHRPSLPPPSSRTKMIAPWVRAFLSALDQWAEDHNCAILIISHPPKSDSVQSGSTDWRNGVQAVWTLETAQVKDKEGKKLVPTAGGERILRVDKLNEGAVPIPVYLNFAGGRFAEVEKPTQPECERPGPREPHGRKPTRWTRLRKCGRSCVRAVRRKPELNLLNNCSLPEPQDVASAIVESEPWMVDGLQKFTARAETLINALSKNGGADALATLLQKEAPMDTARFVQLKWGCHYLLTAKEMSENSWHFHQSADPDIQDLLAAGFEALHLIWQEVGVKAGLKHPVAPLIEAWLRRPEPIRPDVEKNGQPRKNGIMPSGLFSQQPATVPRATRIYPRQRRSDSWTRGKSPSPTTAVRRAFGRGRHTGYAASAGRRRRIPRSAARPRRHAWTSACSSSPCCRCLSISGGQAAAMSGVRP